MTATQLKAIIAHGETLQAIFPKTRQMDPVRLCKQLRRLETKAHKAATDYCNGLIQTDDWPRACNPILAKLNNLLGYVAAGVPVFINGDCRGYACKIESEWMQKQMDKAQKSMTASGYTTWPQGVYRLHRDLGGYGILAPEIDRNGR